MTRKTLKSARPNGHRIALIECTDTSFETPAEYETILLVVGPGCERDDDGDEFDSLVEAEAFYASECKRLASTPNWKAQAAYDAEWGTDNGHRYMTLAELEC
jgi:hypothetical protein